MNFRKVCSMLTARSLSDAGVSVKEIARQAGKSPATIRRWLKVSARCRTQETLEKTMTTTAFDDQFASATETILARNVRDECQQVPDLQVRLAAAIQRATDAEAELARLREQKPVRWHVRGNYFRDGDAAILFASMNSMCGAKVDQLFAAPVPAPHKGATHCDGCGLTWLDDGLNPLGCPYCKDTVPAPAVPVYLLERQENGLSWYIGATTCFGGAWHWTADVNSAIRFSREEDAAACWNIIARHHVGIGGSGTTATTPKQHIFEDARK